MNLGYFRFWTRHCCCIQERQCIMAAICHTFPVGTSFTAFSTISYHWGFITTKEIYQLSCYRVFRAWKDIQPLIDWCISPSNQRNFFSFLLFQHHRGHHWYFNINLLTFVLFNSVYAIRYLLRCLIVFLLLPLFGLLSPKVIWILFNNMV